MGQEQQILSLPPALQAVDSNLANTEVRGRFFSPLRQLSFLLSPHSCGFGYFRGQIPRVTRTKGRALFLFPPLQCVQCCPKDAVLLLTAELWQPAALCVFPTPRREVQSCDAGESGCLSGGLALKRRAPTLC